jgi:hypothetical protein
MIPVATARVPAAAGDERRRDWRNSPGREPTVSPYIAKTMPEDVRLTSVITHAAIPLNLTFQPFVNPCTGKRLAGRPS